MAKRQQRDRSEDQARVRSLHAEGLGRNEIARRTGFALGHVTKLCQEMGLSFDRALTVAPATEAKRQDNAKLRADLIDRLYREANRKLTQLESERVELWPTLARGEGGVEETKRLSYIPARDYSQVSQSVGYLVSHASRLESVDNPAGAAATSLLQALADRIGVRDADA
jgi:hypothetical protein